MDTISKKYKQMQRTLLEARGGAENHPMMSHIRELGFGVSRGGYSPIRGDDVDTLVSKLHSQNIQPSHTVYAHPSIPNHEIVVDHANKYAHIRSKN